MKSLILKITLIIIAALSLPYVIKSCAKGISSKVITINDVKNASVKLFVKEINDDINKKPSELVYSNYKNDTMITMVKTDQKAKEFYYNLCKKIAKDDPTRIKNYSNALKYHFNYYKITTSNNDEIVVKIKDHIDNINKLSH
jgi:predicted transport protein